MERVKEEAELKAMEDELARREKAKEDAERRAADATAKAMQEAKKKLDDTTPEGPE